MRLAAKHVHPGIGRHPESKNTILVSATGGPPLLWFTRRREGAKRTSFPDSDSTWVTSSRLRAFA